MVRGVVGGNGSGQWYGGHYINTGCNHCSVLLSLLAFS